MQEKRYSEMSEFELHQEISQLNEKSKKAEQMGMASEFAVYERKILLARSYLLDPEQVETNKTYELLEGNSTFEVSYLNGRFAWGYRDGSSELEAVPISLLKM
ncbi:YfhH family protein [Bacillus sp. FJAT-45350]|uniref:YfhH family protein n=1 Tax=Bacillus sp. FJAT-45350 TaxID=2011014 RepID=UPI000BB71773|nr:YfhH family protein [Bacillus sp. FJAT-45350]